ncbi:DNA translocase FtsK [Candidatus Wolfebacteria bacterium]|nr:DNA translocase FtsK [Candidatus Wolfebacteria bacterium]
MAKRGKKRKGNFSVGLGEEALHGILIVCSFVVAILFMLAAFSLAGPIGTRLYTFLSHLLGIGYFLLPLLALLLGIALTKALHNKLFGVTKIVGAILFILSGLGLIELVADERGGLVGEWISHPLVRFFDVYASGSILLALFIISLIVIFNARPTREMFFFWKRQERPSEEETDAEPEVIAMETEDIIEDAEGEDSREETESVLDRAQQKLEETFAPRHERYTGTPYTPPPLKLLEKDRGTPRAGDVKANANIIRRTLANFGIMVEVEEVVVGPSVTQYAIKPAEGVRLSRILGLQNNLELALAAHPVRIEAPIPGRSLVGIEIPNSAKTTVGVGALLGSKLFTDSQNPLLFMLGRSVSGEVHGANLSKLPHLLIAGATGSGKSVAIHTLITSLLYRRGPEQLKFIMVDPKRVELTLYNGIPHLLTPVITDPKKAILALKWLIGEMERRYNLLEEHAVRDIASYHDNILATALKNMGTGDEGDDPSRRGRAEAEEIPELMPYIVVVIDELADIMSSYPRELEAAIVRLAQMSRAVGIHLVLSTQRPSVNVITGLIKANTPARVALQVASQIDSRTILDMAGAEKLLGAGDMLYVSGDMAKPVRIQGGFISEEEVKRVTGYLSKNYAREDFEELALTGTIEHSSRGSDAFDDDDDLYEDARAVVIEAGKASTSYLQRKLRVGYARAARLMDILEERGVIGPADGAKPRDVLVDSPDTPYDNAES